MVHFPLAFLIGAFAFDVASRLVGNPSLWLTGGRLALLGVATALLAAIPGFLDYFFTVPPKSSGKRRATWHMVLNLLVVVLYAAAVLLRRGSQPVPVGAVLALEGVGTVLLAISGYLGGVLITRNQIGVDHRYAEAGHWKEAAPRPDPSGELIVAQSGELAVDQMKLLRVMGKRIVLARTEDGYTAFDDRCTHRGGSLADGVIISGQVQCPWHGSQFDCRTGAVVNGPARERIGTYFVEEREGRVILHLDRRGREEPQRIPVTVGQ